MFDHGRRNITDGETLDSAGGSFTLGFFSPGVTTRRYLGIWFSVSENAVCWVANRERLLNDTSAAPSCGSRSTIRRTPCCLANLWTGAEWYLTSWLSANDPALGPYRRGTETSGLPENVVWDSDVKKYRTGPWNGLWFNGVPEMPSYADMFPYQVTVSPGEITYGYHAKAVLENKPCARLSGWLASAGAPFSRVVVTEDGAIQRLVWDASWDASSRGWKTFYSAPRDVCDAYARCGAFGLCDVNAASTSFCSCAKGFSPASPSAWRMREASGGCRRDVPLDCGNGTTTTTTDGFVVVRSVKLPHTHNAAVDMGITVEECRARNMRSKTWSHGRASRNNVVVEMEADKPLNTAAVIFIDLATVEKATRNFSERNVIGEGSFGNVYEGQLPSDHPLGEGLPGRKVAVKRLKLSSLPNRVLDDFTREVAVMSKLLHDNLVQLLAFRDQGNERLLVYEYMHNRSLNLYIFGTY
ncbi:G-type lectin S-receptor-like serine/threonine-protein kinase [Dichanthelium oligosanthes]|uniref:G-type lectin S-receptor-like serine/threonine-protein kinase n=1 Tax=Dichanthelium oligosanthes TaxID=888268 RepID=A0A1E5VM26_9POAL|nr:G-type lectin S-receptor-like serine/threonine-protein kinase [Dichanthelium oligosanthes]